MLSGCLVSLITLQNVLILIVHRRKRCKTAFMLSGCLFSLITLQNDIILLVHHRKHFETLVRVLQSENGECHERIIMEPLWTLLSTFNKGRRRKIVHCSR